MIRNYLPGPLQQQYNQDPRLAIAQSMIQEGSSSAPVGHWAQGLGRLAQTLAGNYKQNKVQGEYDKRAGDYRTNLAKALAGPNAIQGLSQSQDPMLQEMGLDAQLQQLMRESPVSYKTLTDTEEKAMGLDPSGVYQQGSDQSLKIVQDPSAPQKPSSGIAQIQADLANGFITPEQAQAAIRKETYIAPQQPKDPRIPSIVTLIGPDNQPISLQDSDPRVPQLLQQGYVQRSGADPVSKPTADTVKNQGLLQVAGPELDTALQNYTSLSDTWAQSLQNVPVLGNIAASEGYQRARNSIEVIAQSYLYSTSGATASPQETEKLVNGVMPAIGDSPATLADKKARLENMVGALRSKAATPGALPSAVSPGIKQLNDLYGTPGAPAP